MILQFSMMCPSSPSHESPRDTLYVLISFIFATIFSEKTGIDLHRESINMPLCLQPIQLFPSKYSS